MTYNWNICALWFIHHLQLVRIWSFHFWAYSSLDIGAEEVRLHIDSQHLVSQVKGEVHAKYLLMKKYANRVKDRLSLFKAYEIVHMSKEHNTIVNFLSKLESTELQMSTIIISNRNLRNLFSPQWWLWSMWQQEQQSPLGSPRSWYMLRVKHIQQTPLNPF